jgi:hypothetical protein
MPTIAVGLRIESVIDETRMTPISSLRSTMRSNVGKVSLMKSEWAAPIRARAKFVALAVRTKVAVANMATR